MKHLYEGGTNEYINNSGHMNKMDNLPIYGHTLIFFYGITKACPCNVHTQGAKSLYLAKKRLEVTSPAIVVLNAFLDSSDLPKEGLSGLLWKFFGVML